MGRERGHHGFMLINGVELGVEHQVDELGHRPTMLWGHGLTSSRANEDARNLFAVEASASAAGYDLVRYDARGHGTSEGTKDPSHYRWDSLAQDALAIHHTMASPATPWVVGGASMGAATTLHLAVVHPEVVAAMILVIPPTAWATRAAQREQYQKGAEFVRQHGRSAYVAAANLMPVIELFANEPEAARFAPDINEALLPIVLEGAAASDLPSEHELRALSMPALILAWDTDPGHPVVTAQRLAEYLPHSELYVASTLAQVRSWGPTITQFLQGLG